MENLPEENALYRHKNCNIYRVLFLTNEGFLSADYPITVVYQNISNRKKYSRPASRWAGSFTKILF